MGKDIKRRSTAGVVAMGISIGWAVLFALFLLGLDAVNSNPDDIFYEAKVSDFALYATFTFVATIFTILGFSLKKEIYYLLAGIAFSISLLIGWQFMAFIAAPLILSFVAFAKQKKINEEYQVAISNGGN